MLSELVKERHEKKALIESLLLSHRLRDEQCLKLQNELAKERDEVNELSVSLAFSQEELQTETREKEALVESNVAAQTQLTKAMERMKSC